jgi:hypothetical protein
MIQDLYIQIRDGQPFEHPILGSNLRQARPDVDVDNLPSEFAIFIRHPRPTLGTYEVLDAPDPVYQWIDGAVQDVWLVRPMNDEERNAKDAAFNRRIEDMRKNILDEANAKLALANDAGKPLIETYITEITSYTVPDITQPRFPGMPKVDSEGNVTTVNSSGSAPNVIG